MLQNLFYLSIILLPVQLSRHFWPNSALVSGIRIDYLSPTIYLTDIIILLIIFLCLKSTFKTISKKLLSKPLLFIILLLFLLLNIYFSQNKIASLFSFFKLTELLLFAFSILQIKPKLSDLTTPLSFAMFFTALTTIGQFLKQSSISPFLWFLGERSFTSGTPGIALVDFGGALYLRPYATFPHPNVLGGFLAIGLTFLIYFLIKKNAPAKNIKNLFLYITAFLSFISLLLTFSLSAYIAFSLAALFLFFKKRKAFDKKSIFLSLTISLIVLLLFLISFLKFNSLYINEDLSTRNNLNQVSFSLFLKNPIFGVGLNNFIPFLPRYLPVTYKTYFWQPVHNIFLLILAECGLIGLSLFLYLLYISLVKSFYYYRKQIFLPLILILEVLILGFFDHYLITLEQGQILLTLVFALAFLPKNSYT